MELQDKYKKLQDYLRNLGSVAVAFSSGVDSTFLLAAAVDTLGKENVMAVTASSCSFPERELKEAQAFCKERGIRHVITASEELDIDGFRHNPKNRCYLCKHELFEKILAIAGENHLAAVVEGSNMDVRDCLPWQNWGSRAHFGQQNWIKRISVPYPSRWVCRPGTSSHLPAYLPALSMGRPLVRSVLVW